MSNEPRRSSRIANTPKISYEEKKFELHSPPSTRKRRDLNLRSSSDKKLKKIKLRHEVSTELIFEKTDDDDTIISESNESTENKSIDLIGILNHSFSTTNDANDKFYFSNNDEIDQEPEDEQLNNEELDEDNKLENKSSDKNDLFNKLLSNDLIDEDGFLIQNDDTTDPFSSQENQNIIDVTNYDKFSNNDESTIISESESKVNNENKKAPTKRTKKFVKKQKFKETSIKINKLIKHTDEEIDKNNDLKANSIVDNEISESPVEKSKAKVSTIKSKKKNKTDVKTNFVDFFQTEKITKSNDELTNNEKTIHPDLISKNKETPSIKRKRGRPRKSDSTNKSTESTSLLKPSSLPTKAESDDEINVVEVINKPVFNDLNNQCEKPILNEQVESLFLNSKNNVTSLSKNNDENIIVLNKTEEISTFSSVVKSDDPWTIKYKPLHSDQVLDNKQASENIKNWISDFSTRSSNRFYYDDDDDDSGPTGCAKTAMVYALAEELNYKVFEINCSSKRNSKFINQIKEATLSHTVSRQSGSTNNSPCKNNSSKKCVKPPIDPKQKSLLSFLQKKNSSSQPQIIVNSSMDESSFSQESTNDLQALSINSNSLVLFDDVDVIFEEDTGFWQALTSLIENTKKPILLTATNSIENIKQELRRPLCVKMNYPTLPKLTNHLKDIVFKECYKKLDIEIIDDHDYNKTPILDRHIKQIELISRDNHCDIRSCVNKLQFDFSSVNITTEQDSISKINQQSKVNQDKSSNNNDDSNEIDLSTYNNLILSDLFSTDRLFHKNSRDERDNSCTFDETYKSKDLRESVLYEFNKLNSEKFNLITSKKSSDNDEELKWLNDFKMCTEEVENHLMTTPKQDFYCDYLSYLSLIMNFEQERLELFIKHTRRARRFMHYLDDIQFYLSDSAKQFLNEHYFRPHKKEDLND